MTKGRPTTSLLLIHGAASGPRIFASWYPWFPQIEVCAVDLQENLDVERAGMADYAAVVVSAVRRLPGPVALCGWSIGGLVAMLASDELRSSHLILIEPSAPAQIQGVRPEVELVAGIFDPEGVYGHFPPGPPARAESSLARAEDKRGSPSYQFHARCSSSTAVSFRMSEAGTWLDFTPQRNRSSPTSITGHSSRMHEYRAIEC